MSNGLSVKLPLSKTQVDGFALNRTLPEMVRQNLKNLLLTNPGERIMDPYFGVGLKRFIFDPNERHTHDLIRTKIAEQLKKYMPFITIASVDFTSDDDGPNIMYIKFRYLIAPLNQTDVLDLKIS